MAAFAVLAGLSALVIPDGGGRTELAWAAVVTAALLLATGMAAGSPAPVHAAVAVLGAIFLARHDMRLLLAPLYGAGLLVMEDLAIQVIESRGLERVALDAIGARIAARLAAATAGACAAAAAALAVTEAPGRSVALTALGGVALVSAFARVSYLARRRDREPSDGEPTI